MCFGHCADEEEITAEHLTAEREAGTPSHSTAGWAVKSGNAIAAERQQEAPRSTKRDANVVASSVPDATQLDAVRCAEPEEAQRQRDQLRPGHGAAADAQPARDRRRRQQPRTAARASPPSGETRRS